MNVFKQKVLVVLGPTASGKTDFGIALAKQFDGEIISADSRQVYKKMSIGTAKPVGEWRVAEGGHKRYIVQDVPHFGIDIIDPGKTFTMADFKKLAMDAIAEIASRGKLPIIVGGTGLYIWSVVDNLEMPPGAPNKKLRRGFEQKSLAELSELLRRIDPDAAHVIDMKNKRRVLRALEVAITTGESFVHQRKQGTILYDTLQLGLQWDLSELQKRIDTRVDLQIHQGLLAEVIELSKKYSWDLPSMSGIGYREFSFYLRGEMTLAESISLLKRDTRRYAKRQMTWFKRDKRIEWLQQVNINERGAALVKKFLK